MESDTIHISADILFICQQTISRPDIRLNPPTIQPLLLVTVERAFYSPCYEGLMVFYILVLCAMFTIFT